MAKQSIEKTKKASKTVPSFEPNKMTVAVAGSSVVILVLLAVIVTRF